jgi:hypothetical protein
MKKEHEQLLTDSEQVVQNKLMDFILKVVQNYYDVNEDYYKRKTRKYEILFPRQVAMYLIRQNTKLSLNSIGEKFGNKNHATIINGVKRIKGYVDVDKQIRMEVKDIQQTITLKSSSAIEGYNLNEVFYYIDLNDFDSLRIGENKSILLSGFSEQELEQLKSVFVGIEEFRKHNNTGMYILEKRQENGEQREEK